MIKYTSCFIITQLCVSIAAGVEGRTSKNVPIARAVLQADELLRDASIPPVYWDNEARQLLDRARQLEESSDKTAKRNNRIQPLTSADKSLLERFEFAKQRHDSAKFMIDTAGYFDGPLWAVVEITTIDPMPDGSLRLQGTSRPRRGARLNYRTAAERSPTRRPYARSPGQTNPLSSMSLKERQEFHERIDLDLRIALDLAKSIDIAKLAKLRRCRAVFTVESYEIRQPFTNPVLPTVIGSVVCDLIEMEKRFVKTD